MTSLNYNQVIQGFPSFRVFIFGQDVTEYCTDISYNWSCGRAASFATIQLLNLHDRFMIRRDDMVALYPDKIKKFAIQAPNSDLASLYNQIISEDLIIEDSVRDPRSIKSKVVKLKQNNTYYVTTTPTDPFTGTPGGEINAPIYPMIEGKSIFHQNDPVRVFVQDPFDPEVWYYFFAGTITQIGDDVNGTNLEKVLNIQCEDVSKSLRYARITANPGFRNANLFQSNNDLANFTFFTSALQGKSFQELADYLVFGETVTNTPNDSMLSPVPVVAKDGTTFNRMLLKTAAGNFQPLALKDRTYTIAQASNPARTVTTLSDWQNNVLNHNVEIGDIEYLRARSQNPVTASQVVTNLQSQVKAAQDAGDYTASLTMAIINEIGGDPANYPVDGGTLLMLLPEGLGKLGEDVVAKDYISSISQITEFKDRRSVMYDLVSRVEFVFYADPVGNLVIEFPLYDFDPSDFATPSTTGVIVPATTGGSGDGTSAAKFTSVSNSGVVTFDNVRRFTIEDEVLDGFTATDSDSPVKTVAYKVPVVSLGFKAAEGPGARAPEVVKLDTLIPIYGWRAMQCDTGKPVTTQRAALISCATDLNKTNAEAYTYKLPILPRFSAWLNRPMLFKHRNHIATVTSINHKISWGSDIRTIINFNYARGWTGDIDSQAGRMIYETIGGRSSRAINYSALFAHVKTANSNSVGTSSGSGV